MTDDKPEDRVRHPASESPGPATTRPGGASPDRQAREAAALRANLSRRKAQQRARRSGGTAAGVGDGDGRDDGA